MFSCMLTVMVALFMAHSQYKHAILYAIAHIDPDFGKIQINMTCYHDIKSAIQAFLLRIVSAFIPIL